MAASPLLKYQSEVTTVEGSFFFTLMISTEALPSQALVSRVTTTIPHDPDLFSDDQYACQVIAQFPHAKIQVEVRDSSNKLIAQQTINKRISLSTFGPESEQPPQTCNIPMRLGKTHLDDAGMHGFDIRIKLSKGLLIWHPFSDGLWLDGEIGGDGINYIQLLSLYPRKDGPRKDDDKKSSWQYFFHSNDTGLSDYYGTVVMSTMKLEK